MRNLILLFFTIFSLIFSAQTYTFDYVLKNEIERLKPKPEGKYLQQFAINSSNKTYELYIYDEEYAVLF